MDYKEKFAIVIGGSEGIGFSVAKALVNQGARLVIASRSEEKLNRAKQLLPACQTVSIDVTDYDSVKRGIDALVSKEGVPDLVINCAGYATPTYLENLSPDQIRGMMETNYMGTVHVCKAIEPHLRKKGGGQIVTTSSLAGFMGLFGYTGYCGSKFAVIGFSEALRRELKPFGIRVSVLCPPTTRTPGLKTENKVKPAEVWEMEQKSKAVDPDFVAAKLLRGLKNGKFLIIPTLDGKVAYYLNRYAPWILELFLKRKDVSA